MLVSFLGSALFFSVFRLDEGFQAGEIRTPEAAVLLQPGVHGFEGLGIELIETVPAFLPLLHQVGAAQQAEVPGNSRPRNGKRVRDLSGGLAALPQQVEQGAAGWVGERAESPLHRICNRTVTHYA